MLKLIWQRKKDAEAEAERKLKEAQKLMLIKI